MQIAPTRFRIAADAPTAEPAMTGAAPDQHVEIEPDSVALPLHQSPSRYPSTRAVLKTLGAAALVGTGAGLYRAGEAVAARVNMNRVAHNVSADRAVDVTNADQAPPAASWNSVSPNETYVQFGNVHVAHDLVPGFTQAMHVLKQFPGTNKTLHALLNATRYYSGLPLKISTDSMKANEYDPARNTINWFSDVKLVSPDPQNPDVLIGHSPVANLAHEMKHAEHWLTDPVAALVRSGLAHPQYDTLEEKQAILAVNRDLAAMPGEAPSFGNHESVNRRADNITDNTVDQTDIESGENHAMINEKRELYSQYNYRFGLGVSTLDATTSSAFKAIDAYKSHFPCSFNNTNLLKMYDLANEGKAISIAYATANHDLSAQPVLISELDAYVQRAEQFADNLYSNSGDNHWMLGNVASKPRGNICAQPDLDALKNAFSHNGDSGNATLTPISASNRLSEAYISPPALSAPLHAPIPPPGHAAAAQSSP